MAGRTGWRAPGRAIGLVALALAIVLMHAVPGACVESASSSSSSAVADVGAHRSAPADVGSHGCPEAGTTVQHCLSGAVQSGVDVAGPATVGLPGGDGARLGHHGVDGALASMTRCAHGPPRQLDLVADLCVNRV